MSSPYPLQVAILDDHRLFRMGIGILLQGWSEVIISSGDLPDFIEQLRTTPKVPDVLLLSTNLYGKGMDANCVMEWLRVSVFEFPVVILFVDNDKNVQQLLTAGAVGKIHKAAEIEEFKRTLGKLRRSPLQEGDS